MVVYEFEKNECRFGSGVRRRVVDSGVEKVTSRRFFSDVTYLGQKKCNQSLLLGDDLSLLTILRIILFARGFLRLFVFLGPQLSFS